MASQDPSTAYTVAPEKKSSWFPSLSMPKLPDFFGTSTPAPVPAPVAAVAEQSSVQPGGRRRRRRGGVLSLSKPSKPVTSKSQLNSQRAMIKLAIKNSMKKKAKGGRKTKKHSRR
jgi:hypothetical protein